MVENKLTLPVKIVVSIKKPRDDERHLQDLFDYKLV